MVMAWWLTLLRCHHIQLNWWWQIKIVIMLVWSGQWSVWPSIPQSALRPHQAVSFHYQDTRAPGHTFLLTPGHQDTRTPGHQDTRATGHQDNRAWMALGRKGTYFSCILEIWYLYCQLPLNAHHLTTSSWSFCSFSIILLTKSIKSPQKCIYLDYLNY